MLLNILKGIKNIPGQTRHQWLMPVILATQEAAIRRIKVQSQPQTNSLQDPISKKNLHKKRGLVEWFKV
jgi:hypothetical protein